MALPTERIRGRLGVAIRLRRLKRTHGLCEDCLAKDRIEVATAVDHIVPLAKGGKDVDENTRNLCKLHHEARTAEQFGHKPRIAIGIDGWPV